MHGTAKRVIKQNIEDLVGHLFQQVIIIIFFFNCRWKGTTAYVPNAMDDTLGCFMINISILLLEGVWRKNHFGFVVMIYIHKPAKYASR